VAAKRSAGILLYRRVGGDVEVLLGHMGGPYWARKDLRAWSVPKGEYDVDEDPIDAARREFLEELGVAAPDGDLVELGEARQSGGKVVTVWGVEGVFEASQIVPGTFEMEWPKGSGQIQQFPEVDRVAWFGLAEARNKVVAGQRPFLDRLLAHVSR
jgi:predicted NUDIX family NTP pyrophosphohydrolase